MNDLSLVGRTIDRDRLKREIRLLVRDAAMLSTDDQNFVSVMEFRMKEGLPIGDHDASRVLDISTNVQGDMAW